MGKGFEAGTLYLPQLLMSAEAAGAAFEALKSGMKGERGSEYPGRIVIATVRGDIHDIGKNIVRTLLENYGFPSPTWARTSRPRRCWRRPPPRTCASSASRR